MHIKPLVAVPAYLVAVFMFWITGSSGLFIPNLTEKCYRCLCYVASECNMTRACTEGYCGPFRISKVYWADAGMVTLPYDEPERTNAWSDCAKDYRCAKNIIKGYLEKFGKDCNDDGVTNCYDYMMINGNGGYGCRTPLEQSENGRRWIQRYKECEL